MPYADATQLVADLRSRKISARELLDITIARIEALDPQINAVVVRDFERAMPEAADADAALDRGERRPLLGLPITVKEAFNVAGLPTTWGLPGAEQIPVREDAVVVARLKAAGAVVVGKTNVPTILADWQCANAVYGATSNPWDLTRTSGGSSGGGAAALAAGMVSLEFGSDLAASLRAPAAFCGVYAHKPTFGIVPTRGLAPPGAPCGPLTPSLDLAVVGPMARSAADLELALGVTVGADTPADLACRIALPPPRHERLADFRVLVLDEHPSIPTASSIRDAIQRRADALAKAGCRVTDADQRLPSMADNAALFVELLLSQFSAESSDEAFAAARAAADALPPGLDPLSSAGARAPALSHRDWVRADRRRSQQAAAWRELFAEVDIVLCPAMPTTAFRHDDPAVARGELSVDGSTMRYNAQPLWAALATVTGQPATVAPIGNDQDGMPIGVQLIGPLFEDRTTLRFAQLMAAAFGGFEPPTRLREGKRAGPPD
jgi:amidase